jgi:hypothetical protein
MRRNPSLDVTLDQLQAAGIKPTAEHGGKHIRIRLLNAHGGKRSYTVAFSASDWRATHNARANVRRMLRADGALQPKRSPIVTLDCGLSNSAASERSN